MKKLFITTLTIATLLTSPAYALGTSIKVDVNGLVCDFCARALEKVFSKQETVEDINVDLDTKVITINMKDGQNLDDETITNLITDSGYNVEGIRRDD